MSEPTASAAAKSRQIVVVGGGITGLAAAHRLTELDPGCRVTLLEAGTRLGGVLDTAHRDGFLIERSADNFLAQPAWAADLCRRIGFREQLIPTTPGDRNAMVVHDGRLERVPAGFMLMAPARIWPLVTTPILSPRGKLRLLSEYFVRQRDQDIDESLAAFARRRLGREAYERIVQPLVGGIYTADPERLSLRATLPRFAEMERRHGSLMRAARRDQSGASAEGQPNAVESGARYAMFVAPREGLASMVGAIAAKLPPGTIRLQTAVERISRTPQGLWSIETRANDAAPTTNHERHDQTDARHECDAVIVAAPAPRAAPMLAELDADLAGELRQIEYAGAAVVCLGYRRDQVSHPLNSFGFVVPAVEKRRILAGSFSHVKFAGRAPADGVLVRVFIGGACQAELLNLPDKELETIATSELAELLGTRGAPLVVDIARWPASMPQYHLGHCERIERIECAAERWPTLALAGNAYRGVGIPNCVHSGEQAAQHVLRGLGQA